MATTQTTPALTGRPVIDRDGQALGALDTVYRDPETNRPSWGVVKMGRFGRRHFVPLHGVSEDAQEVRLPATKSQVKDAPRFQPGAPLGNEVDERLRRHYGTGDTTGAAAPTTTGAATTGAAAGAAATAPAAATATREQELLRRRRTMAIPRTRGMMSGLLIVLAAVWGGLIPFVGPSFDFGFGTSSWHFTWDRFWLSILPAAVAIVGGLLLMRARHRASGGMGGWMALAAGAWFAVGPACSLLWNGGGPAAPIGRALGGDGRQTLEFVTFYYGLGALIVALAAFALGRLATVSVRDLEVAAKRDGVYGPRL